MEVLASLRKQSLKKSALGTVVILAIAVAVFIIGDCAYLFKSFSPRTPASLKVEEIEGQYVKMDVDYLYGSYAYTQETKNGRGTGKILNEEYLIDWDKDYCIGMMVRGDDMEAARLLNEEMVPTDDPMHIEGTVLPMDEETIGIYHEALGYDSLSPQEQQIYLPYYIKVGFVGETIKSTSIAMLVVSVVLVAWAALRVAKVYTGAYQKTVRKVLAGMPGDEQQKLEELDAFYKGTEPVNGIRMGEEFVMFQNGPSTVLLRPWDVAWAYQITTQHRRNGIPTGKSFALKLCLMDGRSYQLGMSEQAVQQTLDAFNERMPGTVLGFNDELAKAYKQNRQAFKDRWEQARPGCTTRS